MDDFLIRENITYVIDNKLVDTITGLKKVGFRAWHHSMEGVPSL
jgi:hypothetical protein